MKTIVIMAESLDGVIAHDVDHAANWTSREDKQFFISETKKGGVIVFGRNTFLTLGDKPLPGRLNVVMTKNKDDQSKSIEGLVEFKHKYSPKKIVEELKKRKFKKIFIGGGSIINSLFLDSGLVDELWITIEPKIFGTGLRIFSELKRDINLKLISAKRIKETVILKYGVNYGGDVKN